MTKSKYVFNPDVEFKKEYYECKDDSTAILVIDGDYCRRWKKIWGTDAVLIYEIKDTCLDREAVNENWRRLTDQEVRILKRLYEDRIG